MRRTLIVVAIVLAVGVSAIGLYAAGNNRTCPMSAQTTCGMNAAQASGCCGSQSQPSAQKSTVVSAVCPVMGNKIPDVTKAAGKSVYKGKTYYFCCAGCKPKFDKDPAKYVK